MTTSNKNNSVKNYQTFENIKRMYKKAFGEEPCNMQATILNGGLKNAVYLILEKNRKFVRFFCCIQLSEGIEAISGCSG